MNGEGKIGLADAKGGESPFPSIEGEHQFPSDLIDPEIKKTKEYCLKYMKAAYYRYRNDQCFVTSTRRSDWIENRKYAHGNQSTKKYAGYLSKVKNAQNKLISYLNLDWSIIKIIPKFRDVVLSYFDKIDYDVFCDSINPQAHLARENAKWRIWAEKQTAPFFQEMAQAANEPLLAETNQFLPETLQELDMMMQYSFRLQEEWEMELGQQIVLNENDWKEISRQLREDGFDLGVMATCVYIDRISGRVRVRYVDPVNMIIEDFRGHNGSSMQRIGEIRRMTIAQLRLEAGNQITEDEYYQIARNSVGKNGNLGTFVEDYINTDDQYQPESMRNWDNNYIYVMDMDWDSSDRLKFERNTRYGNEMTYRKPFRTKTKPKTQMVDIDGSIYEEEVYAIDVKTTYTCKWVIGSNICYDYGRASNIPRSHENPKECYKRYKVRRISNVSTIERMIYFADSIQLTALKIQNLKARAIPKGIFIEMGAFENVLLDSRPMKASEILEIGFQTGIWIYRKDDTVDDSQGTPYRPIEESEGGLGREFAELVQSMANDIDMLRQVTGINEFMDASTPHPEAAVGTGKMAVAGAQNALHPQMAGYVKLHEEVCSYIALLMQFLSRYKKIGGYVNSLGAGAKFYEITNSIDRDQETGTPIIYGIRIEARATQEMKQRVIAAADAALASAMQTGQGGIELQDHIEIVRMVENGTNLKLVSAILNHRIQKYKQQQQAMKMQDIEAQSREIQNQTRVAKEEERATMKFKTDEEIRAYTHKTNEDIRKMIEEYKLRSQNDVVKQAAKAAAPS